MEHSNGYAEQCKNWSEDFTARSNGYAAQASARPGGAKLVLRRNLSRGRR